MHDARLIDQPLYFQYLAGHMVVIIFGPDCQIHELYTAACGLYVCWLTIRQDGNFGMDATGIGDGFFRVKEWSLMVGLSSQDWSCLTVVVAVFPVVSLNLFTLFLRCVDCVKKVDFLN